MFMWKKIKLFGWNIVLSRAVAGKVPILHMCVNVISQEDSYTKAPDRAVSDTTMDCFVNFLLQILIQLISYYSTQMFLTNYIRISL